MLKTCKHALIFLQDENWAYAHKPKLDANQAPVPSTPIRGQPPFLVDALLAFKTPPSVPRQNKIWYLDSDGGVSFGAGSTRQRHAWIWSGSSAAQMPFIVTPDSTAALRFGRHSLLNPQRSDRRQRAATLELLRALRRQCMLRCASSRNTGY